MEEKTVAYEVYTTDNYEIFKRLLGNRDVSENRISRIVESIQKVGYIHNPIIVNEKMEVIDGQGRLTALQRLHLPVEYIIAPGTGTKECVFMNRNMINWKLTDYIKSFAEQGNENYKRMLDLMNKYANGNLDIISTAVYRLSKAKHRDIVEGSLQLTEDQYNTAVPRLEFIQPILNEIDEKRLPGSIVILMQTLIYYFDYPEVDKDRLTYSVKTYIYTTFPWVANTDCEREVENIYNHNRRLENKVSIAHLIKEERVKRQLELNRANRLRALKRVEKGTKGFSMNTETEEGNKNGENTEI